MSESDTLTKIADLYKIYLCYLEKAYVGHNTVIDRLTVLNRSKRMNKRSDTRINVILSILEFWGRDTRRLNIHQLWS